MAGVTIPQLDRENLEVSGARSRVQSSPDMFGAIEARALQHVAGAFDNVARIAQEKDDEFNAADARNLDNQLAARIRTRMYDPQQGYLSTARGVHAAERRADVEAGIRQDYEEVAAGARSARSRALYQEAGARRISGTLDSVSVHLANEARTAETESLEARIQEGISGAVAAFGDDAAVNAQMGTVLGAISRAAELNGWTPEVTLARARQVQSELLTAVIQERAATDPEGAQALFDRIAPGLDAQHRGELHTAMRVAQRDFIDRVEGEAWNAFAQGRPLSSMDENAYAQLTTNPLLGQSFARLTEAYRTRAQSYATSGRIRDNSPAYIAGLLAATQDPGGFTAPGALENYLTEHAGDISNGDMADLIVRRQQMVQSGQGNSDAGAQQTAFNAVRGVAANALGAYGLDLSITDTAPAPARQRVAAFDAALQREVSAFVASERRQPNADETQILIGRAVVGMQDANLQGLPEFRVSGARANAERREGGTSVLATTDAVVPFAAIPLATRQVIISRLRAQLGHMPTQGDVENTYARYLLSTGAP